MAGPARLASTALGLALGRCGAERGLGLVKADALGRDGVPPSSPTKPSTRLGCSATPRSRARFAASQARRSSFASCAPSLPSRSRSGLDRMMGVDSASTPCIVKYGDPVVVPMPATPSSRLPRAETRASQPGTRGDVQPLGPPADPQAGLVHVLDRRRFHQVADRLDDAFEAPGAASAHPRDGRRNQGDGEQIRHQLGQTIFRARAGSATGRPPWPRSARHTAPGR